MRTKHVALHVPDLQRAEEFYRRVFDLEVVSREALTGGSLTEDAPWAQLPHTATWEDALTFLDPLGFRWQLCGPGFAGPGDTQGRWLEIP